MIDTVIASIQRGRECTARITAATMSTGQQARIISTDVDIWICAVIYITIRMCIHITT